MKKLMIAAFAIAFAAVAQAAFVNWNIEGIQVTGDFESGEGTYAAGYMVYLFSDAIVEQSIVAGAISSDTGWNDLLGSSIANTVANGDGGLVINGIEVADGTFNGYMLIFDAATTADAKFAFVTDIYTAEDNAMHTIPFGDLDGDGYVNAIGTWSAVNGEAVPEPTSALMLLVGLAGLALKRKVA